MEAERRFFVGFCPFLRIVPTDFERGSGERLSAEYLSIWVSKKEPPAQPKAIAANKNRGTSCFVEDGSGGAGFVMESGTDCGVDSSNVVTGGNGRDESVSIGPGLNSPNVATLPTKTSVIHNPPQKRNGCLWSNCLRCEKRGCCSGGLLDKLSIDALNGQDNFYHA